MVKHHRITDSGCISRRDNARGLAFRTHVELVALVHNHDDRLLIFVQYHLASENLPYRFALRLRNLTMINIA